MGSTDVAMKGLGRPERAPSLNRVLNDGGELFSSFSPDQ
jgi:hypothetical protein